MTRYALPGTLAIVCAGALGNAQIPPRTTGQPQDPARPASTVERQAHVDQQRGTVTLVGCLYRERDVAGRQPNVAERAGVLEDYILAIATPATMYKVEHLADDQLRRFVGQRVEVTGRIDTDEFEATSIRAVAGTCPATPSVTRRQGAAQTPPAVEVESKPPVTPAQAHPPTQQTHPPMTQTETPVTTAQTAAPRTTLTLVGCVYREDAVRGRTPNAAERAGILEDYILADARVGEDRPAAGTMYKLEHVADERLRQFVGKRVEVTGRIDIEADEMKQVGTSGMAEPQPDRSLGPDRIELPEFEVGSIREVAGACPATPSPQ